MKIELHTHTSEISSCSHLTVNEIIDLYIEAGYDAMVIANHFNSETADEVNAEFYEDFIDKFWGVLDEAMEIGRKKGLLVLPALELRFDCNVNDYLVYGMNREMCRNCKNLFAMTPDEFSVYAKENGVLFYQAHPFRNRMTVVNPAILFGIEVQNTHPRHDSRNDIAMAWAEKYNLHKIAGSDCHQKCDVGSSAVITEYAVKNIQDLIYILKNDMYQIVKC